MSLGAGGGGGGVWLTTAFAAAALCFLGSRTIVRPLWTAGFASATIERRSMGRATEDLLLY